MMKLKPMCVNYRKYGNADTRELCGLCGHNLCMEVGTKYFQAYLSGCIWMFGFFGFFGFLEKCGE